MIDLRSDTVTKPSAAMLEAMMDAPVGDDVFGEDESVNRLQSMVADLFGMEDALFCPSGTMTNQIAINVHTIPGGEVICSSIAHIYMYEGGGIARNSGASVALIEGDRGRFRLEDVCELIRPDDLHRPVTKLVAVENTVNKGGGAIWDYSELKRISDFCASHCIAFHLDGARLFNALVETGEKPSQYGEIFDSISICLSKGLGAPVGSVLAGSSSFIKEAKRVRKVFGGGMRQAGFLAAAGIFALENNISRLKYDHRRAKELERILSSLSFVENVLPVETNIVIFTLADSIDGKDFLQKLKSKGLLASSMGKREIRFVTHLDFTDSMLEDAAKILKSL